MRYPRDADWRPSEVNDTWEFIHCNGTQLRLADSNLGSEQYTDDDYYVWDSEALKGGELLFIFPTRVNLTTITVHYYSDNIRGFPHVTFFDVEDDYDIWDTARVSVLYNRVHLKPPDGESTGRSSVSVNQVDFPITNLRILMYVSMRFQGNFPLEFAVSEVEFFTNMSCGRFTCRDFFLCTPSYFNHFYQFDVTASTARTDPFSLIWLLMVIIVVNFVNGTFTIDDSMTGVYTDKQADATDTSGNTSQYKTELQQ